MVMLRIEMVLPSLVRDGMEVVTAELGRALFDRGYHVGFTCVEALGELGQDLQEQGLDVKVVAAPGLLPNFVARELGSWFRRRGVDVVHAHSGVWLKAVQGARWARVPKTLFTAHGMSGLDSWISRTLATVAVRRTDHVVAVSQPLKSHLMDVLRVRETDVTVIANAVSASRFSPGPPPDGLRESLAIPAAAKVIGSTARFHPVKNHRLLLEAFARLRAGRPNALLLLVGDGPLASDIQDQVGALGLQDHVRMTGLVRDTAPYLRLMDLFVLSSNSEGTSIGLLEAMASGVPVLATAVGGTPDLLDHGRFGALTPPGDPIALASGMAALLEDGNLSRELSSRASREVGSSYSIAAMTDRYERLYHDP